MLPDERPTYRVLVVEDDAVTSMIVAAALTADGRAASVLARFTVACRSTLEEALACARDDAFDAILLDLSLPDSCGLESFTRMRAAAPAPAIVIVTALDDDRIAMAAMGQGAQDYLIKGSIESNVVARSLLYAITRRRAERESREHAARLAGILDSAMDGIVTLDAQDRLVLFNRAAERIFRCRADVALGQPASIFLPGPWSDVRDRLVDAGEIDGVASEVLAMEAQRADGERFRCEISLSIVEAAGQRLTTLILRDVTERARAAHLLKQRDEQLRQAQQRESLGRLAAGVAHEFNNLLTVITGNSDALLAEYAADPSTSATLREVLRASRRASALTTQLLSFSGRQQFTPTVVDVSDLVGQVHDTLRGAAGQDIALVLTSDGGAHRVNADPVQIERVLLNLVMNARDALPSGGIISVETSLLSVRDGSAWEPQVAMGEYVAIVVRDNGRGMTPDVRARLFEPFFTTKDDGAKSGLGLSTVLGVMQQSGGAIRCESTPGGGSAFSLIFPRVVSAPVKSTDVAAMDECGESGALILVAEDEPALRGLVHRILERHGYRVMTVASGAEAMLKLEQHPGPRPDLLLTDIVMPGMRGTQLAERVSFLLPQLPVLFMSGYADDDAIRRGTLAPNARFLKKPFTAGELVEAVRRAVLVGAGTGSG